MLDAIADFWKPVKRLHVRLKPEELQIGSTVSFSTVPQPSLSGRKLTVSAINTYKFGPDVLTSFVLSQEKDAGASMIVADSSGEPYIAISRRISISDRNKLFAHEDIEAVIKNPDITDLSVREITTEYKGWVMPHYKREQHHNVKGQLYKGDHRVSGLVIGASAMDFSYTLLVSDNHEHALEIEQYDDGRVEVYATVYRRMSDVSEVTHPSAKEVSRPDMKLVSKDATPTITPPAKPAPKLGEGATPNVPEKKVAIEAKAPEVKAPEVKAPEVKQEPKKEPEVIAAENKSADVRAHAATSPVKLPEFAAESVAKKEEAAPAFLAKPVSPPAAPQPPAKKETAAEALPSVIIQSSNQPYIQQEIKAVSKETSNFVNESIDCELHVANTIIDEAIRKEMRINDVVRKVIGLPVSQQESVQIPVALTEQDYALLAIRYGISASDHDGIKKRIVDDLSDFSGSNKQKKAA